MTKHKKLVWFDTTIISAAAAAAAADEITIITTIAHICITTGIYKLIQQVTLWASKGADMVESEAEVKAD